MTHLRGFRSLGAIVIVLMTAAAVMAQTADPLAAMQQKLNSQFKLTRSTADRSDIVTAGDVLQLHRDGLIMYATTSPLPPSNSYKNGRIGQGWGGFGKDLAIGMASPEGTTANDYGRRAFVAEEKCWVTAIQVQKDGVVFQLYSDPFNDVRYYANLKIPFPVKKEVPPLDAFLKTIAEVITVVPQDDQAAQQPAAPAAPEPAVAAAPAPLPPIAPPPPATDAPPPTVSMGETKTEVTAAFGQPLKAAKIGTKEIYYYKDMKVTFLAGKVSNVE